MRVYRVSLETLNGGMVVDSEESLKEVIFRDLLPEMGKTEYFVVTIEEMSQEELEGLEEFPGW